MTNQERKLRASYEKAWSELVAATAERNRASLRWRETATALEEYLARKAMGEKK